jgi:hypothetical protein
MANIIISYRRSDSAAIAGRIRDRLAEYYGADAVFMDIDSIPFGIDFRQQIQEVVTKNDIMHGGCRSFQYLWVAHRCRKAALYPKVSKTCAF